MGALSNIEQLIREGCLSAALDAARQGVRDSPGDVAVRRSLFALLAASGEWQKCRQQAEALSKLETDQSDWISVMGVLSSASKRDEFWSRTGQVSILGNPVEEDLTTLENAILSVKNGTMALEASPAFGPGRIDSTPFELIGTADDRLPGVLEVSMDGDYFWLWLGSVRRLETATRSKNIIDAMWIPARVFLENGERLDVTIFGIYPGTSASSSEKAKLGIELVWREDIGDVAVAEGPQFLIVDEIPKLLKDIKNLEFDEVEEEPEQAAP